MHKLGSLSTSELTHLYERIGEATLGTDPELRRSFSYFRSKILEELQNRV